MAFQNPINAIEWATTLQQRLLHTPWPERLIAHPAASEEWNDEGTQLIFKYIHFSSFFFPLY